MEKDQMIQVALAGFPESLHNEVKQLEFFGWGDVYRLYDPNKGFNKILPNSTYISISFFSGEKDFAQIQVGNKMFNHYAGISKMIDLGILNQLQ